jgi:hypothetical protein
MTTTLQLLYQVYKDVQTDYIDSSDREEALGLIAELTIKLAELR